jgi:hypothetical protein
LGWSPYFVFKKPAGDFTRREARPNKKLLSLLKKNFFFSYKKRGKRWAAVTLAYDPRGK